MPDDTLTHPAPTSLAPAAPTGLRAEVDDDRTVRLTWKASAGAEAYEVHEMLKDPAKTFKERVPGTSRSKKMKVGKYRYGVKAVAGGQESAMSALVDVTVPKADGPGDEDPRRGEHHAPSGSVPGKLIDLTRWYLALPIARKNDPKEKPQNVYQRDEKEGGLLTFSDPKYFHVSGDAVEYIAPVEGATTSKESGATRCELREMTGPTKDDEARWTLGETKRHVLTCTLTCNPTSIKGKGKDDFRPRKECIVGQIHSSEDTPPLYLAFKMLNGAPGVLELCLDHRKETLLTGLGPETRFTYRIEAKGDTCRVWAAVGDDWERDTDPTVVKVKDFKSTQKCYFKAGAYNLTKIQKNGDKGVNTGESIVRHYRLDVV